MTRTEESPQALSLGVVLGDSDSESRAFGDAVMAVARRVAQLRVGVESPLNLNVVFHVSGRLVPNTFEGVRTGRFSGRDSHLMVQVAIDSAVPRPGEEAIVGWIRDAIGEAERFARRRKIADSLPALGSLVDRIARLGDTPN